MVIERTHYFAKPGQAENMLAVRRRACRIRLSIGLAKGTIHLKPDPGAEGPDVVWECRFASLKDQQQDLAARAASAEFPRLRSEIDALLEGRNVFGKVLLLP